MDEISKIASRIYVLNRGSLALDGSSSYVFSQFERIKELGLSLPQITEILYMLNKKLGRVNYNKLDIDSGTDEILSCIKRYNKWK